MNSHIGVAAGGALGRRKNGGRNLQGKL